MLEITLSPSGRLHCSCDENQESIYAEELISAFENEGTGAGLFILASGQYKDLSPSAFFWKNYAERYLVELCHTPEGAEVIEEIKPPAPAEMLEILLGIPPMTGAEYLTVTVLDEAWLAIDYWVGEKVAEKGNLSEFLKYFAPHWHQVGRVCFHLAENKDDEEYPFAFMATYASGLTKSGKPRYLPMASALQEYGGNNNKKALLRLLTPVSTAAEKSKLIFSLLDDGDIYHPYPFTADEAYLFLTEIPQYEEAGLLVKVPDWWRKRTRVQVSVTVDSKSSGKFSADSLLEFNIDAVFDGKKLTKKELAELIDAGSGLRFVKGKWVEVDAEKLQQVLDHWQEVSARVGEGISLLAGMRLLSGSNLGLQEHAGDEEIREWSFIKAGEKLAALLADIRSPERLKAALPGKNLKATLRPYQKDGLNWLWLLSELGLGACLADDMGLGKTIQILALLLMYKKKPEKILPTLVVLPASLLGNWQSEVERFSPSLKCIYYHRSMLSKNAMAEIAGNFTGLSKDVDVVFTTYAMASRSAWLKEQEWNLCVLDEAQAIKNPGVKQTRQIKKINARVKIILTGTPVENRLSDLWSLFDFINSGLLGSFAVFKEFVKGLESREHEQYKPLRNLVKPYILRRLKTDRNIIADLPEKTEVKAFCSLTKKQAALYQKNVKDMSALLDSIQGNERRGLVLSFLTRFKQICNHPSQFSGDNIFERSESGKFNRLREICEEIASRQEKVLIFTQYREMTEPISDFLSEIFNMPGLILHGGTPVKKRKTMVDQFQNRDDCPFFVLSLKAGGTGLNLTAASHVIHFDRWWNPAVENQATDRAFRIGQKNNVLVHKFICPGTLEEKIDELITDKTQMSDDILGGESEKTNAITEMSNSEILDLVALDIHNE